MPKCVLIVQKWQSNIDPMGMSNCLGICPILYATHWISNHHFISITTDIVRIIVYSAVLCNVSSAFLATGFLNHNNPGMTIGTDLIRIFVFMSQGGLVIRLFWSNADLAIIKYCFVRQRIVLCLPVLKEWDTSILQLIRCSKFNSKKTTE